MPKDINSTNGGEWVGGVPVQSEKIAFGADEMVACSRCLKLNPPNRTSCLYCAQAIDLPEDRKKSAKLNRRPLENWEKGFNLVFVPPAGAPDVAEISRYLSIDPVVLQRMIEVRHPIPIARLGSEADAVIAAGRLQNLALDTTVIGDDLLHADKPLTRLRAIEFLH